MCNDVRFIIYPLTKCRACGRAHQKCPVLTHSFNVPMSFAFKPRPYDSRFQLMYINILYIVPDANSQRGKFIASAAVYEPPTAIGEISGNWSRLRKTSLTRIRLYYSRPICTKLSSNKFLNALNTFVFCANVRASVVWYLRYNYLTKIQVEIENRSRNRNMSYMHSSKKSDWMH